MNHSIQHTPTQSSSWFPFLWVSRHDNEGKVHQQSSTVQNDTGTNVPSNNIESSISNEYTTPQTSSKDSSHSSLVSELNEVKQLLMPAARSCANAINNANNSQSTDAAYEFRQARSICNPYESLGMTFSKNHATANKHTSKKRKYSHQQQSSPGLSQFINRSAIKLANIDALLGFVLTTTDMREGQKKQQKNENDSFVFVDLCGAPGGFSEYILYRHVHPATTQANNQHAPDNDGTTNQESDKSAAASILRPCFGFGMSLLGINDDGKGVPWDLDHLERYHLHCNGSTKSNETTNSKSISSSPKLSYHVCNGMDNTGSIYNWDNVLQLQLDIISMAPTTKGEIRSYNRKSLANLVVADGGFDAQRDCSNQEKIAHRIVVSQAAAALTLLGSGGTFVLKMFGFQEEGTRCMMRYLYDIFDEVMIVKPISSRPASAERYLVCCGYACPDAEYSGFMWREEMIAVSNENKAPPDQKYAKLEKMMDVFDREMLELNIKTCRDIINYLDEKRDCVIGGASSDGKRRHLIELKLYEKAWQLH